MTLFLFNFKLFFMASYTGMSNLQNHPHRSGFDIGRKNAFTAKVGELLPVYWDISMPNDKYKFNVEYFTRTQPVETSAYTRLREYFDFYAVPLRLLWKSAPSVLTQMQDINQIQALSLTQNLSLGTYLPSLTLNFLSKAVTSLGGNSVSAGSSSSSVNSFGFFRSDINREIQVYLFVKQMSLIGEPEMISELKYPISTIVSTIVENIIRSFATPQGMHELEHLLYNKPHEKTTKP